MVKINQMKKDELFEGFYLIKSAEVRQTRAGKNYLAFVFQDETGTIEGKLWDAQPHNVESFMAGRVVHMSGRREVYNNTPQVNQLNMRLPQAGEPNNPADFKEKPPVDPKELHEYLSNMIFKIENPVWQRIVRASMGNMRKSFIVIQLLRPTTMPLKQALLIIRQPWSAWQIVSAISILS